MQRALAQTPGTRGHWLVVVAAVAAHVGHDIEAERRIDVAGAGAGDHDPGHVLEAASDAGASEELSETFGSRPP